MFLMMMMMMMIKNMHILVALLALLVGAAAAAPVASNYRLASVTPDALGFTGVLELIPTTGDQPYGEANVPTLALRVGMETRDRVHVKIWDPHYPRWEARVALTASLGRSQQSPLQVPGIVQTAPPPSKPATTAYAVTYTTEPFGLAVTRVADDVTVFNTTPPAGSGRAGLAFTPHYLEISTVLGDGTGHDEPDVYGLGERVSEHLRLDPNNRTYETWARCQVQALDSNQYGVHPFFLERRRGGASHGVFLLNSNALGVTLERDRLTYRAVGGVLDFYVLAGPAPADVVRQYVEVVGRPYHPPYWSLGWHQCRYGYRSLGEVKTVVQRYREENLPLDAIWVDIESMDEHKDFTFDPNAFPVSEMRTFVSDLAAANQRYVPILDPCIKNETGYAPYDRGVAAGVFVTDPRTDAPLVGRVWPGMCVFPDWLAPNASAWWEGEIREFHDVTGVPFDGLWVDMNEPCNFCNGRAACTRRLQAVAPVLDADADADAFDPNTPPFNPISERLDRTTVAMEALHGGAGSAGGAAAVPAGGGGGSLNGSRAAEFDAHSLYGHLESLATARGLQTVTGHRPFVLTRSTFSGTGHHAAHWLGDNYSTWPFLRHSIPGTLAMNLFGVPHVGADVCGFSYNATAELCARWMDLGSFYGFARNHNGNKESSQEPYVFNDQVTAISRAAIERRYRLLPYLSTLFHDAHTTGAAVWRPLLYEFPADDDAVRVDMQFLLGPALLVSPAVHQGVDTVTAHVPAAVWFDYSTGQALCRDATGAAAACAAHTAVFPAPLGVVPLHLRGGFIVPTQDAALTTAAARLTPFTLMVAVSPVTGRADGTLYRDDGLSVDTTASACVVTLSLSTAYDCDGCRDGVATLEGSASDTSGPCGAAFGSTRLQTARVYGLLGAPATAASVRDGSGAARDATAAAWDADAQVLEVRGIDVSLAAAQWSVSWRFRASPGVPPSWWTPERTAVVVSVCIVAAAIMGVVVWKREPLRRAWRSTGLGRHWRARELRPAPAAARPYATLEEAEAEAEAEDAAAEGQA